MFVLNERGNSIKTIECDSAWNWHYVENSNICKILALNAGLTNNTLKDNIYNLFLFLIVVKIYSHSIIHTKLINTRCVCVTVYVFLLYFKLVILSLYQSRTSRKSLIANEICHNLTRR